MTEKEFQAQIVELVGVLGGMVYHTYDSRRSAPGFPDLTIVTRDRRLIFAELKNDRGRVTEYQKSWLEALPDHQVYLWRPDDQHDAAHIIQVGHRTQYKALDSGHIGGPRMGSVAAGERTCITCQTALDKP